MATLFCYIKWNADNPPQHKYCITFQSKDEAEVAKSMIDKLVSRLDKEMTNAESEIICYGAIIDFMQEHRTPAYDGLINLIRRVVPFRHGWTFETIIDTTAGGFVTLL